MCLKSQAHLRRSAVRSVCNPNFTQPANVRVSDCCHVEVPYTLESSLTTRIDAIHEDYAMAKPLRVGIIGASAAGGWAREGHIPAVQHLAGLELAAVATNNQQRADAAANAFGAPAAFANAMYLIRAPEIDLVTIAVPIQSHRELVLASLAACEHVYGERPLGRGYGEPQEMAAAAQTAGVHVAIGLQLRGNPVREASTRDDNFRRDRTRAQRAQLFRHGRVWANRSGAIHVPRRSRNFANLITIQGAHAIDLAIALVGGLADLSALATAQYSEIEAG